MFRVGKGGSPRAMATASSDIAGDPAISANPPPSASGKISSSSPSPLLPLPSPFSAQSLLGRPPNPPAGVFYSAPGRGFPPRPVALARGYSSPHMVTVANPAGYIRNSNPTAVVALQPRAGGFQSDHGVTVYQHHPQRFQRQQQGSVHQIRPSFQPPQSRTGGNEIRASPRPDFVATVAAPFAAKVSSFPVENSKLEQREKNRDDGTSRVYDRKVRLSETPSGSLYGLCRSWLRDGLHQEIQPKFGDGAQLLPKPLPHKTCGSTSLGRIALIAEDEDTEPEENEESIGRKSSARDLLQRHVKRAKRVRACLREERLQRIERYKQRLALLLPLPADSERSPGS
ncbi:uncharacterized protein LOC144713916 [Wolffia australiana]